MRTLTLDELRQAVGTELGVSQWHVVSQERIEAFADATDDHQWIHVDVERAREGPFGGPIAHGFLTLSLLPMLLHEIYGVSGAAATINYGLNRVRFPAPLPSGGAVRARARVASAEEVPGGLQVVTAAEVEVRDAARPCCVAELVTRFLT